MAPIEIRLLTPEDDVVQLNALLREAYQALADAGMRYAASYEDVEATRRRMREGECHLAILEGRIVGCVILRLYTPGDLTGPDSKKPAWYLRPEVANFGRFAVRPELQGTGIGTRLMDHIEARVRALGYRELALDTSERAAHLIRLYEKRGYRFIEHHQWDSTNYRSVILSKTL